MTEVVLGVGMSSSATTDEVRTLVESALAARHLTLLDVAMLATRRRFIADPRVVGLGLPVVGIDDDRLTSASEPCSRSVGIRARVAETAALLATAVRDPMRPGGPRLPAGVGHLMGPVERSAHATVAVATRAAIDES